MILSKISTFKSPVKIRIPSGGSNFETTLSVEYKIFSASEMEKKQKEWAEQFNGETSEAIKARTQAFFDSVILSVEGLEGEDGTPMDGAAGRVAIKDYPFLQSALLEFYNDKMGTIRVKN